VLLWSSPGDRPLSTSAALRHRHYLLLAQQENIELATLDGELARAAAAEGVRLIIAQ
jgi:predicted nucleic acid-binding protein